MRHDKWINVEHTVKFKQKNAVKRLTLELITFCLNNIRILQV